jgi:hypothetical protein
MSTPPEPTTPPEPDPEKNYEAVTDKVVETRTPTSSTRFHVPNERVELEREKYEDARHERQVQPLRAILPNPRERR